MLELLKMISLSKKYLSVEAYVKIIRIIEQDRHCIIDQGLMGDPGPNGQDYSSENRFTISEMPLKIPPNES